MTKLTASIDFDGPFFQVDPGETMLKNLQKMMAGIAEEGATAVRAAYAAGESQRDLVRMTQDRVSEHVIGRVTARPSRGGRHWVSAAVVQVYNEGLSAAESRSLMAAGSYVERRTRAIRSLARQVRSSRAVLTANLTAGME